MTEILDGRTAAREVRAEVRAEVEKLVAEGHRPPGLAVVLVGEDPASRIYVGSKTRAAAEVGFVQRSVELAASTSAQELMAAIDRLNREETIDGVIVQLPLPPGIESRKILEAIEPDKDVDGLHPVNVGRLWLDQGGLFPATPTGIIELLVRAGVELDGRHAVVVGRSHLVGKPLAALLLRNQCTVTLCHSHTRNLAAVTQTADILVAAVGKLAMIGPDQVRQGATVIDVGIHRVEDAATVERLFPGDRKRRETLERKGRIVTGDVDYQRVAPLCTAITPVPGGVGPMTVAMLLANTLIAAKRRQGIGSGETTV
jgi:methylenetetrahydrofolate dehydrogenase (NADP+)/methenyltetrahydrofolate cyclohydrolase